MDQIRNIKSLYVFSVVAGLLSVSGAARLLSISQSSVSYHIRKLEDALQVTLFHRGRSGLTLTAHGARLASFVEVGLESIRKGVLSLADLESSKRVRVAVPTMFASRWLSGRLGSFWERFPEVHLSFRHHNNTFATSASAVRIADLGIQWGRGTWEGFNSEVVLRERMVLVCSPRYLAKVALNDVRDVYNGTLLVGSRQLYVDDRAMWEEWFAKHNLTYSADQKEMRLEDRHFQLSTALNGHGIVLFIKSYILNELNSGQLVMPFDHHFDTSFAYHLVTRKGDVLSPEARLFHSWLRTEGQN